NEVVNVLGIEAARQSIIWECKQCFKESNVNFRHLGLLADLMTHQGHLMSIERHGINRRDTGPIKRATYEEMVEILARAASDGISDDLNGVSQRILLGDVIPLGTGSFDLLLDVEKVISGSSEADAHIMSHQGMDGDAYATALAYDTAHDTAATAMVDRNAEGLDDIQLSGDDGMFGADSAFTATQTALQTANGGIISAGVGYTGAESGTGLESGFDTAMGGTGPGGLQTGIGISSQGGLTADAMMTDFMSGFQGDGLYSGDHTTDLRDTWGQSSSSPSNPQYASASEDQDGLILQFGEEDDDDKDFGDDDDDEDDDDKDFGDDDDDAFYV
ncbi:hypothetical protein ADUPG1_007441, partial [Aduncisulcus paluster]